MAYCIIRSTKKKGCELKSLGIHVARPRYDIHVIKKKKKKKKKVSPEFFHSFPKTLKCSLTFFHL